MGCADITGIISLVITVAMTLIGFVTPYWIVNNNPPDYVLKNYHWGLLAQCRSHSCVWVFEENSFQPYLTDWFKATQGCMSVGLGLGLIALLIATMSLCCTCHSCNPNAPICALLIVACLAMGVGVVIFGIKAKNDWGIELSWDRSILGSLAGGGRFGWSYWVSIGAAGLALLTSAIYGCIGRKTDY